MLASLVAKYRHKGVLIDTNLLIGFLIGGWNPRHLIHCRATKSFNEQDFALLDRFLGNFQTLVTTPQILTEVSNLAGKLPKQLHAEFRARFGGLIDGLLEKYEPSKAIASHKDFISFGLADTAISMISPGNHLVLTDEVALFNLLQKRGVDAVNFNHLRGEALLLRAK